MQCNALPRARGGAVNCGDDDLGVAVMGHVANTLKHHQIGAGDVFNHAGGVDVQPHGGVEIAVHDLRNPLCGLLAVAGSGKFAYKPDGVLK